MYVMINIPITQRNINACFKTSKFWSVKPADICKCIRHPHNAFATHSVVPMLYDVVKIEAQIYSSTKQKVAARNS